MKLHHLSTLFVLVIIGSSFANTAPDAKIIKKTDNFFSSKQKTADFERRLRNFLQTTKLSPGGNLKNRSTISQGDLFLLTKVWDKLDKDVKTAYKQFISIPDSLKTYISPGKHFEIYYSPLLNDPLLKKDSIGYNQVNNWRQKINLPNGIPDYVDEIAWALDSSWSMEVDKFGFNQPFPYVDQNRNSTLYKVVAVNESGYGSTFPVQKVATQNGWSSLIHININYNSFANGTGFENGIRVTCAHEFFHAIQFAMTNNVSDEFSLTLDDYPLTWIEGTAACMEELAFPDVNDYLQYTNLFFTTPTISFVHDGERETAFYSNFYSNVPLALYLYYHTQQLPDITFIRSVFVNSFVNRIPFYQNLSITSKSFGYSWTELLNRFHTASFFTGSRFDTSTFLSDAHLILDWDYSIYNSNKNGPSTRSISPFAMGIYNYKPAFMSDTLIIKLEHKSQTNVSAYQTWAASLILRKTGRDTIVPITLDMNGDGLIKISSWKLFTDAIVIITNGDPSGTRDYAVTFEDCPRTHNASESFTVFKEAENHNSSAKMAVKTLSDVNCDMTLITTQKESLFNQAKSSLLSPLSVFYETVLPYSWISGTSRLFTISVPGLKDTANIQLYTWDENSGKWSIVSASTRVSGDTLHVSTNISQSGIYGVFRKERHLTLSVFPNPVSLRRKSISFEGMIIKSFSIFNANGILVYKQIFKEESYRASWKLTNSHSLQITPGLYTAVFTCSDPSQNKDKIIQKKLLVIP